jgi:hypothetical protein
MNINLVIKDKKYLLISAIFLGLSLDLLGNMNLSGINYNSLFGIIGIFCIWYLIYESLKTDFDLFAYTFICLILIGEYIGVKNYLDLFQILFAFFYVMLFLYTVNIKKNNKLPLVIFFLCFQIVFIDIVSFTSTSLLTLALIIFNKKHMLYDLRIKNIVQAITLFGIIIAVLILKLIYAENFDSMLSLANKSEKVAILTIVTLTSILTVYRNLKSLILFEFIILVSIVFELNIEEFIVTFWILNIIVFRFSPTKSRIIFITLFLPLLLFDKDFLNFEYLRTYIIIVMTYIVFSRIRLNTRSIFEWVVNRDVQKYYYSDYYDISIVDESFYKQESSYNLGIDNAYKHYYLLGWYFKKNPNKIILEEFVQNKLGSKSWTAPALSQLNLLVSLGEDVTVFVNEKYYKERYQPQFRIGAQDYFYGGWKLGRNPRAEINSNLVIIQLYRNKPRNPVLEYLQFYPENKVFDELVKRPQLTGDFKPFI